MQNNESKEDTWFWLTAKQRHEHKHKIWITIYIIGCVILYFGIPQLFIDLIGTHKVIYKPEKDLFLSLFDAVTVLIRPVIAFFIFAIPVMLFWALYVGCRDYFTNNRKKRQKAKET